MRIARGLGAAVAVAVIAAGATSAFGAALLSMGGLTPAEGGTVESKAYALSPDGLYAVGSSNVAVGASTFERPVIFSTATGQLVQLPNLAVVPTVPGTGAQRATGVLVRYDSGTSTNNIAIAGGFLQSVTPFKWQMQSYQAPLSNLAGGTWVNNTLGSGGLAGIVGPYNAARMRTTATGDQWFIAGDRSGNVRDFNMGMNGASSFEHQGHKIGTVTWDAVANSITGNGSAAGYIKQTTALPDPLTNPRRATYLNGTNSSVQTPIPGGSQFDSEAVGISPNPANLILCGFDFSDTTHSKAFIWRPGDAAMTLLNPLGNNTLAGAIDVRGIGGNYITAGYSSDGTTERATIWDTTGVWDSTGAPLLVSDLLTAAGVSLTDWNSLTRVTSMSDDGKTLAGWGVWNDGTTRGFIATIPEPATLSLLTLGALSLLRRRRH